MLDLNNRSILITGGTGSFGKMFVKLILKRYPKVEKLAYCPGIIKSTL